MNKYFSIVLILVLSGCVLFKNPPPVEKITKIDNENKMDSLSYLKKIDLFPALNKHIELNDMIVDPVIKDGANLIKFTVKKRSKNFWDQYVNIQFDQPFKKGDLMGLAIFVNCTESSDESSMGQCTFQHNMPWSGKWQLPILTKTYSLKKGWHWYFLPYIAKTRESDKLCISFKLGLSKPQSFLVAKAFWYKFDKTKTSFDKLPYTRISYSGRELDAPWRKEADKRIEKYRKGNFKLKLSYNGIPLKNTKVNIKLFHHKFAFALAMPPKLYTGPDNKKEEIPEYFNSIVLPNAFKWPFFKYPHCQKSISEIMEWARQKDLKSRGHCMVWGSFRNMPPNMKQYEDKPEELRKHLLAHINEMSIGTPPIMEQWDVINEPFLEKDIMKVCGDKIIDEIMITAKKANPNFKTYINDYGILSGFDLGHQNGFYEIFERLNKKNIPCDGIGFQAYFGNFPIAPNEILKRLDRFNKLGKEMYLTEYNMSNEDPNLFADYTRDLLTVIFSYPAMTGFACWVDMWNPDGSPTKALLNWKHLVKNVWTTNIEPSTDNNGEIKFNGYRGSYYISFDTPKGQITRLVDFSDKNSVDINILPL
jgi:GH35 family endo-1,4-beta-xylanase